MSETDIPEPCTDYAMSKALITNLLKTEKINAVTLRLFSVYGYFEEKYRLVPYLLYSAIKGRTATLSNKNNVRDFVFIEDVARAYEHIIKRSKNIDSGSVFNVGSGRQSRIIDVVDRIGVKVKWSAKTREEEPDRVWKADARKIEKEVGWKPKYSLKEGLEKTKKWMAENVELYEGNKNDKYAKSRIDSH
jgi:nucleoside-diphosphate-sugar epimerase